MTERLDTAAIRAMLEHHDGASWIDLHNKVIYLCNALDEARDYEKSSGRWALLIARAEAAEAELEEAEAELEEMTSRWADVKAAYAAKSLELARLREGTLAALYPNRYDEAQREGNYT